MTSGPMALTVDEVARELKVNPQTVYRMAHRREIGSFKVGRAVRIPRSELERLLNTK